MLEQRPAPGAPPRPCPVETTRDPTGATGQNFASIHLEAAEPRLHSRRPHGLAFARPTHTRSDLATLCGGENTTLSAWVFDDVNLSGLDLNGMRSSAATSSEPTSPAPAWRGDLQRLQAVQRRPLTAQECRRDLNRDGPSAFTPARLLVRGPDPRDPRLQPCGLGRGVVLM